MLLKIKTFDFQRNYTRNEKDIGEKLFTTRKYTN